MFLIKDQSALKHYFVSIVSIDLFKLGPYYKRKLELKSNSSEILLVYSKFICDSTPA